MPSQTPRRSTLRAPRRSWSCQPFSPAPAQEFFCAPPPHPPAPRFAAALRSVRRVASRYTREHMMPMWNQARRPLHSLLSRDEAGEQQSRAVEQLSLLALPESRAHLLLGFLLGLEVARRSSIHRPAPRRGRVAPSYGRLGLGDQRRQHPCRRLALHRRRRRPLLGGGQQCRRQHRLVVGRASTHERRGDEIVSVPLEIALELRAGPRVHGRPLKIVAARVGAVFAGTRKARSRRGGFRRRLHLEYGLRIRQMRTFRLLICLLRLTCRRTIRRGPARAGRCRNVRVHCGLPRLLHDRLAGLTRHLGVRGGHHPPSAAAGVRPVLARAGLAHGELHGHLSCCKF
eukprot:2819270-Prymnesium_polylepis.1